MMDRRRFVALAPRVVAGLALAAAIAWAVANRDLLDAETIRATLDDLGALAPAAFVALWVVATLLFLPGAVLGLLGGALFGPVWGSVWNLAGATAGAALAFLAARYVAGGWVARRARGQLGGRLGWLLASVEAEGWRFVAVTRLVPLFPFNLLNYAFGLTRIGFWQYLAATVVCMLPGTVAYTWFGYAGREAIAGGEGLVRNILLAIGLIAVLAFIPRLVRRLRRREAGGWVEAEALKRDLDAGAPVAVVDVRGPDEFVGPLGHIPGARNIPVDAMADRLAEVDAMAGRRIVLVCKTDKRSARAAAILRDTGHADLAVLRGGMERWTALGYPAEAAAADETLVS